MSSSQDGSPMDWKYDTPPGTKRSYEDYVHQAPIQQAPIQTPIYAPTRRIRSPPDRYPNTHRYPGSALSSEPDAMDIDTTATHAPIYPIRSPPGGYANTYRILNSGLSTERDAMDVDTVRVNDNPTYTDHVYHHPDLQRGVQHAYDNTTHTNHVYDWGVQHARNYPTYTDHIYDPPDLQWGVQHTYPSGGLPAPEATEELTFMQNVGTCIYNVTLWTGLCLANGITYSRPYIRSAAVSSGRCIARGAYDTYRVAAQVVNGVKRRAVELRAPRPALSPQAEQREIIRASHRPPRSSPRQRPLRALPYNMTTHGTASSPHTPTPQSTASTPRTPIHQSTGPSPAVSSGPSPAVSSGSSSAVSSGSASPESPKLNAYYLYWREHPHGGIKKLEELVRRILGVEKANRIIDKVVHCIPLTKRERLELHAALDGKVIEIEPSPPSSVSSSPLSSAPSDLEDYRPEGLDSSPLSSAPSDLEDSSPLSSAPSDIEDYRPEGLDSSSPLSSAPSDIENYRPAWLNQCEFKTPKAAKKVAFQLSPTTGAPATQVKRFTIGEAMDYVETPSPRSGFMNDSIAGTEAGASESPIERHLAHLGRRRDAAVLQTIQNDAFPAARTEVKVIDSPTQRHVAHMERRPSHNDAFPVASKEAKVVDSPTQQHVAHMERQREAFALQLRHIDASLRPAQHGTSLQLVQNDASLEHTHPDTPLQHTRSKAALRPTHTDASLPLTHSNTSLRPAQNGTSLQPIQNDASLEHTHLDAPLRHTRSKAAIRPTHTDASLQVTHNEVALQPTRNDASLQPASNVRTTRSMAARRLTHTDASLQVSHNEAAPHITRKDASLQPAYNVRNTRSMAARQPTHTDTSLQLSHNEDALQPTRNDASLQPAPNARNTRSMAARQPTPTDASLQPAFNARNTRSMTARRPTHTDASLQLSHNEGALQPTRNEASVQPTHNDSALQSIDITVPVTVPTTVPQTSRATVPTTVPITSMQKPSLESVQEDLGVFSISKRTNKERDTVMKRKAEEARLAKAEKEAEEKAREEEARNRRDERRMPSEKVIKPLTAEWEERVDAAMAAGDLPRPSAGCALSRKDLGTVLPVAGRDRAGGWLNDEVVSSYLQAVVDYGKSTTATAGRGKTPKFYAFSTFFYSSIREKGVESVRRWAGKGKIGGRTLLEVERVFVPVHENSHWTLVVVSPMARAIEYFDSLGGAGTRHVGHVQTWLAQELGPAWVEEEWTVVDSPSPRQSNGLDCGVFVVTTAKMITLGINPLAYGPEDIPVQRRRIVAELLNGGFVGDFEP